MMINSVIFLSLESNTFCGRGGLPLISCIVLMLKHNVGNLSRRWMVSCNSKAFREHGLRRIQAGRSGPRLVKPMVFEKKF